MYVNKIIGDMKSIKEMINEVILLILIDVKAIERNNSNTNNSTTNLVHKIAIATPVNIRTIFVDGCTLVRKPFSE